MLFTRTVACGDLLNGLKIYGVQPRSLLVGELQNNLDPFDLPVTGYPAWLRLRIFTRYSYKI